MDSSKGFSRRALLLGTAAAAGAVIGGPGLADKAAAAVTAQSAGKRWAQLSRLTGGGLLRPGDSGFDRAALPNNLRFQHVRPEGIALCASPQMAADVLNWCRDHDMPFVIRGGGHSYSGYSTTRGLLIDTSPMRSIDHDAATGLLRVGAGATNTQLFKAMRRAGRITTHGRCPTVGVAGFLLGGGVGFNMRRYGIASDQLREAGIVTADGKVRTVSKASDADLFWALRGGGGGNFGISTSFTLQTQPVDEQLTTFRMVWRSRTLEAAKALFKACEAAPRGFGSRISLGGVTEGQQAQGRQVSVTLLGQYAGGREALEAILKPVTDVVAPDFADIRTGGYWEGLAFLMEPGAPAWFRERSAFLGSVPSDAFLEAAFERLRQWPGTGAHGDLFFFQTGGRVNEMAADATAFVHRSSHWLAVVGISWSADDNRRPDVAARASDWQDAFFGFVARDGQGAFQNFADASLTDWRQRYFGSNLDQLSAIKAKYDPTGLFRFPQSL